MTGRHWPRIVALVALVCTLTSLRAGWILDDYLHLAVLRQAPAGFAGLPEVTRELFRFVSGDQTERQHLMDEGLLPWWAAPHLKVAFWRPLTAVTHWLDAQLWPHSARLMHLQNVLWYALLIWVLARLYRQFGGATIAVGVAVLYYAIDDGHGMAVGWIANRNALLACFFGVLALHAHDRWRRGGWRPGAVLAPGAFALCLLSAEAGIGFFAYFVAHALWLERAAVWRRAGVLSIYLAIIVIWRAAWHLLGYGAVNNGLYTDPLGDPIHFALSLLQRAPILIQALLGLPPADVTTLLPPRALFALTCFAWWFVISTSVLIGPLLWTDRVQRFWLTGMALAIIPACATPPGDRMLMVAGVGGMAVLGKFLVTALRAPAATAPKQRRWPRLSPGVLRWSGYGCILLHGIIAPLLLIFRAANPLGLPQQIAGLYPQVKDAALAHQDLIVVNPPSAMHVGFARVIAEVRGTPVPRSARGLAPGLPSVEIERPDERTLLVRPAHGYLATRVDRLFRPPTLSLDKGATTHLDGIDVEVIASTPDGRPAAARFTFPAPLEDPRWRWLRWENGVFLPASPPAVGARVQWDAQAADIGWRIFGAAS